MEANGVRASAGYYKDITSGRIFGPVGPGIKMSEDYANIVFDQSRAARVDVAEFLLDPGADLARRARQRRRDILAAPTPSLFPNVAGILQSCGGKPRDLFSMALLSHFLS